METYEAWACLTNEKIWSDTKLDSRGVIDNSWPYPDKHEACTASEPLASRTIAALSEELGEDIDPSVEVTVIETTHYDGYEYEQDNKSTLKILTTGGHEKVFYGKSHENFKKYVAWLDSATLQKNMSAEEFASLYKFAVERGWKYEKDESEETSDISWNYNPIPRTPAQANDIDDDTPKWIKDIVDRLETNDGHVG